MDDRIKVRVCTKEDFFRAIMYIPWNRGKDVLAIHGSIVDGEKKEMEFVYNPNNNEEKIAECYNVTCDSKPEIAMNLTIRPVIESRLLVDYLTYSLYDGNYPLENYKRGNEIVEFGMYPTDILIGYDELLDISGLFDISATSKDGDLFSYTFNYSNSLSEERLIASKECEYNSFRLIKCRIHSYPFGKLFRNKLDLIKGLNSVKYTYKDKEEVILKVSPLEWFIDRENGRLICINPLVCGVSTLNYSIEDKNHVLNRYLNEMFLRDLTQGIDLDKMLSAVYNKEEIDSKISRLPKNLSEDDYKKIRSIGIDDFLALEEMKHKKTKYIDDPFKINVSEENIDSCVDRDIPILYFSSNYDSLLRNLSNKYKNVRIYQFKKEEIKMPFENEEIFIFIVYLDSNNINDIKECLRFISSKNKPSNVRMIMVNPCESIIFSQDIIGLLDSISIFRTKDNFDLLRYTIKNNVHPLLCALIYIVGDSLCADIVKEKELWLLASNILYRTNNINLLRGILGNNLIDILQAKYNNKFYISLHDVINRNYNISDIEKIENKYIEVSYLSQVDESNIEVVRNFVVQMSFELLEYFDLLWSRNNENRKAILDELNRTNNMILKK
ncbi:MAG: hypothetical protein ACI33S_00660 [Bacilli bacterium]